MADGLNGLLTGGLGVELPASAMMLTASIFTLGPISIQVSTPTTPTRSASGGSIPLAPGQIQNFYKPVKAGNDSLPYIIPDQKKYRKQKHVVVKVTLGKQYSKEYLVDQTKADVLIKVINVINKTKDHVSVVVGHIRNSLAKAKVTITNFKQDK